MTVKEIFDYWNSHGTKILGTLQGFLSMFVGTALLVDGLIPKDDLKYWVFANVLLGGATLQRGFVNTKTLEAEPKSRPVQGGFARLSMLVFLVTIMSLAALSACAPNPVKEANTFEQRAWALYGTYIVFQGQAAAIVKDDSVPEKIKLPLRVADGVAYPVAESLVDAALEVSDIRDALNQCTRVPEPAPDCVPTEQQKLAAAISNLSGIYFKARPVLLNMITAVKGAR